jgi:hypothetical protein
VERTNAKLSDRVGVASLFYAQLRFEQFSRVVELEDRVVDLGAPRLKPFLLGCKYVRLREMREIALERPSRRLVP